jgi:hypothetical protein
MRSADAPNAGRLAWRAATQARPGAIGRVSVVGEVAGDPKPVKTTASGVSFPRRWSRVFIDRVISAG